MVLFMRVRCCVVVDVLLCVGVLFIHVVVFVAFFRVVCLYRVCVFVLLLCVYSYTCVRLLRLFCGLLLVC